MSSGKKTKEERSLEAAVFGTEDFYDRFGEDDSDVGNDSERESDRIATSAAIAAYEGLEDEQLFMVDDGDTKMEGLDDLDDGSSESAGEESEKDTRAAAWHDSDDEKLVISLAGAPRLRKLRRTEEEDVISGLEYARRLRSQFERVYPVPDWALPAQQKKIKRRRSAGSATSDSDSDVSIDTNSIALSADPLKAIFQSTKSLIKTTKSSLRPPGKIDIKRLRDANHQAPSHAAIQTMSFHPTYPLLMTGGYDRTLRIYHIDGKVNTLATSLHLRSVPIEHAEFHPDGKRVYIGGRRRYFHIWHLDTGRVQKISRVYGHEGMSTFTMHNFRLSRDGTLMALVGASGWLNFLSAETGQWLDATKLPASISDLVWLANGHVLACTVGADIVIYDPVARCIVDQFRDDGGTNITRVAVGGTNDRWLAVGSQMGIVNLYDRSLGPSSSSSSSSAPPKSASASASALGTGTQARKPVRVLDNLTTSIHSMFISPDAQVLALSSRAKKDRLKLVHLPSGTVFQNWPTQATPLGKVGALAVSPRAEMFCVGNEAGRVTLWAI